jgi:hypothetical protein
MKATVAALKQYSPKRQADWMKFFAKELGIEIEIKEK